MDVKTIPALIVGVVVALAIFGAVIPGFVGASDGAGDAITKTNVGTGHTFKEMVPGDVLKCESVYSNSSRTDTWTLNGETVLNEGITGLTWDWGLISDAFFLQVNSSSNSAVGSVQDITANPGAQTYLAGANGDNPSKTYEWLMNEDKTITQTNTIGETVTTFDKSSTWAYVVSSIEDGAYMSAQVTTNAYYATLGNKDIILAGNYTTGDLDTGYYYGKDGVLTVLNSSYTGTVNFTQELSDGTTDIYDTLVTVSISDGVDTESFSPYRALVPYQVEGHASSGTLYTLIQVLPIIIGAGFVLGAVGWFITRK